MRVGDEHAGFSIDVDPGGQILKVSVWGFWTAAIADQFTASSRDAARTASAPATLELDSRELKPLNDHGQAAFTEFLSALRSLGIKRMTVLNRSALTKLQLLRLLKQSGVSEMVQFN